MSCVFCMDLTTNSDYVTTQHQVIGFYKTEKECVYWAVRTETSCAVQMQLIQQCTTFYFTSMGMFLEPEGQTSEAREPDSTQRSFRNREASDKKVLSRVFQFPKVYGLCYN
jgi:hypothetical protein